MSTAAEKLKRLKVPKDFKGAKVCGAELMELLNCLKNNLEDPRTDCAAQLKRLNECVEASKAKTARHKPTTNYHLQRLGREMLKGGTERATALNRLKLGKPRTRNVDSIQLDEDLDASAAGQGLAPTKRR